ncbi:PWWP domain-containing protein 2A-like [Branchiostoma lanceolatum]|uniref:PWWP2B protein n=1 Tax=Branchiostoma lanceolatum TaxID=7740 RepID=A0A8K0ENM8_BRALA|nr:PWWP2B [Branchiostoma lanceolatum]
MADPKASENGLKRGAEIPATIEEALDDLVVVTLRHGDKVFRGVLLDSSKRDLPYGVADARLRVSGAAIVETCGGENRDPQDGSMEGAKAPELSTLSFRASYGQNIPSPPPRRILKARSTRRNISSNRNIIERSNIKLRPRQILCSKCKECVKDEDSSKVVTSKTAQNTQRAKLAKLENSRKRKDISPAGRKTAKKLKKQNDFETRGVKTSPLIKISYATPQGKGKVLKIPPKVTSTYRYDNTAHDNRSHRLSKSERDKAKKVLKKAKERAQGKATGALTMSPQHRMIQGTANGRPGFRLKRAAIIPHGTTAQTPPLTSSMGSLDRNSVASGDRPATDRGGQHGRQASVGGAYANGPHSDTANSNGGKSKRDKEKKKKKGGISVVLKNFNSQWTQSLDTASINSVRTASSQSSDAWSETSAPSNSYDFAAEPEDTESRNGPKIVPPLKVHLHTKNVTKTMTAQGRTVCLGDIVWGKIHGFPWWPGRVRSITVSRAENGEIVRQDAHVEWFASSTTSHIACSTLSPYLEDFKQRFNKKKRGPYRRAVKIASEACQKQTSELRALYTQFETNSHVA